MSHRTGVDLFKHDVKALMKCLGKRAVFKRRHTGFDVLIDNTVVSLRPEDNAIYGQRRQLLALAR